uniref:Uncharacterized protein n=1 Tax=Arundo donax TaxID=35708 RepID=A0A0A9DRT5_ARUDO
MFLLPFPDDPLTSFSPAIFKALIKASSSFKLKLPRLMNSTSEYSGPISGSNIKIHRPSSLSSPVLVILGGFNVI